MRLYRAGSPLPVPKVAAAVRKPSRVVPTPAPVRALWRELASPDAAKAYRAVHAQTARPEQAVLLLGQKLCRAEAPPPGLARRLTEGLGANDFETRQRSEKGLKTLGDYAAMWLHRAAEASDTSAS